jgi:hypothetical protein
MAVGGGVPGKVAGIVPIMLKEAGLIIEEYRHSTESFPRIGEMIIEQINGWAIPGIINAFRKKNCDATGAHGKETGIGKDTPGELRDYLPNAHTKT